MEYIVRIEEVYRPVPGYNATMMPVLYTWDYAADGEESASGILPFRSNSVPHEAEMN